MIRPTRRWATASRKGEPLFRIDDRDLKAELEIRESSLCAAVAQLHRLEQMPRAEDLPPAVAAVDEARARLLDAEAAYNRDLNLFQKKMLAASDFDKDRYTMQAARASLAKAEADLAKLKAGAWKEDIDVQRAAVEQAQSQVENIKIMLDRLIVRAPVDGEILQVNVRPGQFAALAWKEPMIVLGEVNRLHVRVDIDENDLYRFREGVPAWANIKGREDPEVPARVRAHRALRHPQEEPDRRQHRARGHPCPPGALRPARPASRQGLRRPADGGLPRFGRRRQIPGRHPGNRCAAGRRGARAGSKLAWVQLRMNLAMPALLFAFPRMGFVSMVKRWPGG